MEGISPRETGALQLAYIGDTVYDLYVRTYLVRTSHGTAHKLHMMSTEFVRASAQAKAYHDMEDLLTEEEKAVFRRGRNAHSGTVPKNANVQDYRVATGLEALIGYLYLSGRQERLNLLMNRALLTHLEEKEHD